jgi:LmbE family N-acetylglucosaminyl deacetylase
MGHSDHRAAGTALVDAVYPRAASPHFSPERGGEPWFPQELWLFDCSEPDFSLDISSGFDRKLTALAAHESQQGVAGGLTRAARRIAALFGNEEQPAEGFVRLRLR